MLYGDKQYRPYANLFPTPVENPFDLTTVALQIPKDPAWIGLWIGVILDLCYAENYQVFDGGLSRETVAEVWLNALLDALLDAETLPEPYWDDPEGDDASSGDDNPEYPFFEDVQDFAVSGFILYATGSPTTALQYWTIAKQFRLAVRKHDLGGIVDIFMDGDFLKSIDTYSSTPELGFVDIVSTGSTLRLEFPTEGTVTQVIRKRLWEGEIVPANVRFNVDCQCVESFNEITGEWYPNPQADPRTSIVYLYPPRTGTDPRCNAAANMVAQVQETVDAVVLAVSVVQMANAVMAIITVFVPGISLLVTFIIAVCEALLTIGTTTIALAFSSGVYDQLLCIFYDNISSDGQMTTEQLDDLLDDIDTEIGGTVSLVMLLLASMWGNVGFSNAGTGELTGDCGDCCADVPFESVVTFDLGGYPYEIVTGTLQGGGQSGNCAGNDVPVPRVSPSVGQDIETIVDVDFPDETTVTDIVFWAKAQRSDSASDGVGVSYTLFDADDNVLLTRSYFESANNGWRQFALGTMNVMGVRRIRFRAGMGTSSTGTWTVFTGLDTFTITGTQCITE